MIDWVTCKIRWPHAPIASGALVSITPDGETEWEVVKRRNVPGSHSSQITVSSAGSAGEGLAEYLSISGNPSKFLQGHNLFGSDDLLSLMVDTLDKIDAVLGLGIDQATRARVRAGDFEVSMIDVNYSFTLANQKDVMSWIHAAEFKSRSRFGRPIARPGTIYWNKHSRKWAIKAYSKFNELVNGGKAHRLPDSFGSAASQLIEWAENVLRIELRLLKRELQHLKLTKAADLAPRVQELFAEYQSRIVMNGQRRIAAEKLMELPSKLRATYTLWAEGHFMCELLSKATFYRHRKELLEYGVDISITCDAEHQTSNVVPFMRVLEAKPVSIPDWAFTQGLVHKSAANWR